MKSAAIGRMRSRWFQRMLAGTATILLLVFAPSPVDGSGDAPAALNNNAATDTGADEAPAIATDGAGNWVAVWSSDDSLGGTIGTDFDILVATSSNDGESWTDPAPLNTNAASDSSSDEAPHITTDGSGRWVAVWDGVLSNDRDILVANSTDHGATWSPVEVLKDDSIACVPEIQCPPSRWDESARIAVDDSGTWVATWEALTVAGLFEYYRSVAVSSSTDGGVTWSQVQGRGMTQVSHPSVALSPDLATDGAGTWVLAWGSPDDLGGTIGTDFDILISESDNEGATWSDPAPLNPGADSDGSYDSWPSIKFDGLGNAVAAWVSSNDLDATIGTDLDILTARSVDGGATWSLPQPLNSNAASDSGSDSAPRLVVNGDGDWVATWNSTETLGGLIGTDYDIFFARSSDLGTSWSPGETLNSNAATDAGDDVAPQIETDGNGNWLSVWQSGDDLGATIGADEDILYVRCAEWEAGPDGDGISEACDNCPSWFNPGQELPPWPIAADDADCDGSSAADENYFGTDPDAACGFAAGGEAASENWPADLAPSNDINIADVLALKAPFGLSVPPASPRFDLALSGSINIADVLALKPIFGGSCTP
jgi:hypothetical protein